MSWKHYAGTGLFLVGMFLALYGAISGLAGNIDNETMWSYGTPGFMILSLGLVLLLIERLQRTTN